MATKVPNTPSTKWEWERVIRDDETLTLTQKSLLFLLNAYMSDPAEGCFPSIETLAAKGRMGESTVRRDLLTLVQLGWIKRVSGGGRRRSGRRASNLYLPRIPDLATTGTRYDVARTRYDVAENPLPHSAEETSEEDQEEPRGACVRDEVRSLLLDGWGDKGNITKSRVDRVVSLLDSGWTIADVEWLVTTNTATARTISALDRRLTRAEAMTTPTAARADDELQRWLSGAGRHHGGSTTYAECRPHDEYGPSRILTPEEAWAGD